MSVEKSLFALADGDDAAALLLELGDTPTYRVRSESGETLFLSDPLYRGKAKCVDALQRRGGLTLQEAAAAAILGGVWSQFAIHVGQFVGFLLDEFALASLDVAVDVGGSDNSVSFYVVHGLVGL